MLQSKGAAVAMNFRFLVAKMLIGVGICFGLLLIAGSRPLRAYFFPPSGPFAERLTAIEYDNRGHPNQNVTDALNDLFPSSRYKTTLKGPQSPVNQALKAARFTCSTFHEGSGIESRVCRNDAAGYTPQGCRLDWMIMIDLSSTIPERRRAFVRAYC